MWFRRSQLINISPLFLLSIVFCWGGYSLILINIHKTLVADNFRYLIDIEYSAYSAYPFKKHPRSYVKISLEEVAIFIFRLFMFNLIFYYQQFNQWGVNVPNACASDLHCSLSLSLSLFVCVVILYIIALYIIVYIYVQFLIRFQCKMIFLFSMPHYIQGTKLEA